MFTGIITDIGTVKSVTKGGDTRVEIETSYDTSTIDLGASIACAGACLTVIETGQDWFAIEASRETIDKTTLGRWQKGHRVNLERALKAGDELGGHIVTGHVDGLGEVLTISPDGDSIRIQFRAPAELSSSIATKGSITVDGVSLTVNETGGQDFGVNLIPHTQQNTTLGVLKPGQPVNLEIDLLARYVARALGKE
ncbi:MAG: riboflavin synthase [Rhodospirillaceae bacterium]|jgi:riboflavin synthase